MLLNVRKKKQLSLREKYIHDLENEIEDVNFKLDEEKLRKHLKKKHEEGVLF